MGKYIRKLSILPLITVLALSICGCKKPQPNHIFLITLDTTRWDYITANNAPHLSELAKEGTSFTQGYSLIPITLPSHINMFYSMPPHQTQIYNNSQPTLLKQKGLIPLLRDRGYKTGGVMSLGVLRPSQSIAEGFDRLGNDFIEGIWFKRAGEVTQEAISILDQFKGEKSFLWLHYSDPHEPYIPPRFKGLIAATHNSQQIYSADLTCQPFVKLNLKLKPGPNKVTIRMSLPKDLMDGGEFGMDYLSFRRLQITSPNQDQIQYELPAHWRIRKRNNKINYLSKLRDATIIITNKGQEPIDADMQLVAKLLFPPPIRILLYQEEVKYMDQQIGKLIADLKARGMFEKSTFLIIGDHGEGLGEYRNHWGHISYLNKVYTHVPFILSGVRIKKGIQRPELVSTLDVAPTLLDVAGIEIPDYMKGKSLLSKTHNSHLMLETYAPEARMDAFSLIRFPYQVVYYTKKEKAPLEIYQLDKDPTGTFNILESMGDKQIKVELIKSVKKISKALTQGKVNIGEIPEETKQILKTLGYL